MLKVNSSKYEISEKIVFSRTEGTEEQNIYEFVMNLTDEELLKLKEIITKKDENEEIANICYKEHKEKILEAVGKIRYNEMLEQIKGHIMGFFIKKQMSPYNTTITDLVKTMDSLQQSLSIVNNTK